MEQLDAAMKKIVDDLGWRGPNGKALGNIVLPRAQAEEVLSALKYMERFVAAATK